MKITMFGPFPPPIGGISIHLKRMKQYLEHLGIECNIYNECKWEDVSNRIYPIKNYKSFIFRIPFIKADILHFHSIDVRIRILMGFYKILGKKVVLTVHGESLLDQLQNLRCFTRFVLLWSLKKIDKIICVNDANTNQLIKLGFSPNKVTTIAAYVNPFENKVDSQMIPKQVWDFIDEKDFIICANGCIRFYKNEDLYGIDLLIELIRKLVQNNIEVRMVVAVLDVVGQNERERNYYKSIKNKLTDNNLEGKVLLYEVNDSEFYPIVKKCNLFIRPTNVDGYGVSIAEAIYYNIPSIASDVCRRPEGTVLFRSRDLEDLYSKTVGIIDNYDVEVEKLKYIPIKDNTEPVLEIYKALSKGKL